METLLGIGLGNAILAAVLAVAAAGIGTRCRRPALVHGLWLIVLLKLLTPPLWRIDARPLLPGPPTRAASLFALNSEIATAEPVVAEDWAGQTEPISPAPREMEVPVDLGRSAAEVREPSVVPAGPPPAETPREPRRTAGVLPDRWLSWAVAIVWAVGSVVCGVTIVVRVVRFGRLLRFADPASDEVQELAAMLGRRIGLARPPRVWFVPGSVCPMLWAVGGRPRVLVPRELWRLLNARQRSSLLVHELAHLRRRDHWVRGVELLVAVAYWWFPVAWWARRRLREAEEQCCDAWVVWALPGSGREYAGALLEAVEFVSTGARLPVLASGMGQFASLKRRMTMIRSERVPRALTWYGRIGVVAVGGLLLPMAPSRAQSVTGTETKTEATVKAVAPVATTVQATDERAVIAELAIRADDDADDDDRSESKDKSKDKAKEQREKEKAKAAQDAAREAKDAAKQAKEREAKDREAKEKEARANANRDRRETRKGGEGDDELAAAREEVRELSRELERAAQRLARLEARRAGGQAGAGAYIGPKAMPPTPGKPNAPQVYAGKPTPPTPPTPPMTPGDAGRSNRFDAFNAGAERAREQRLQAMENRLRAMMNEIEAMRRERGDAKPRTTPTEPQAK